MQRCPSCSRQLLMCDCPWEEFARDEEQMRMEEPEEELSEDDVTRMIEVLEAELNRYRDT